MMEGFNTTSYEFLQFKGPLGVVPSTKQDLQDAQDLVIFIIMGATGSGKSAFVEHVAGEGALSISKNSLESVTQTVVPYTVTGVRWGDRQLPLILVDTPGFLDTKISESRVCDMVQKWLGSLTTNRIAAVILYFERITDTRMGGRKRKSILMLQEWIKENFYDVKEAATHRLVVVTTMWNQIANPQKLENARNRMVELETHIWEGKSVVKFEFSRESAFDILNNVYISVTHVEKEAVPKVGYRNLALDSLQQRISDLQQQHQSLKEELQSTPNATKEDKELTKLLKTQRREAEVLLRTFYKDLSKLDPNGYPERIGFARISDGMKDWWAHARSSKQ